MASGGKQMIVNTQERAVSTDINRLQAFAAFDRAEIARFGRDVSSGIDDQDAGGGFAQTISISSPLSAVIENGFQVQPQIGAGIFDLIVTPGVLYAVDNIDADTDASVYRLVVRDPGIVGTGVLQMTAGAGSTRIDVIECQPVQVISETDNRDVFNPVTGLFSAVTLTKATEWHLTYRVRAGTAGAGWPGTANGWLPLAVASVPAAASTNDSITFWDVRPLASGRIFPPYNLKKFYPQILHADCFLDTNTTASHAFLSGTVEVEGAANDTSSDLALYRLGGSLFDPGSVNGIDISLAQYQSSGLGTGPVYVYFAEPFGLPRWAEYGTATFGVRRPRSPRGMVIASTVAPFEGLLTPTAAIAIPPSLGFANTVQRACCFLVTHATGGIINASVVSSNKRQFSNRSGGGFFTAPAGVAGTTDVVFTIVAGTNYPPNAKAIWVNIELAYTVNTNGQIAIYTVDSVGNKILICEFNSLAAGSITVCPNIRIPLGGVNPKTVVASTVGATVLAGTFDTLGWDL